MKLLFLLLLSTVGSITLSAQIGTKWNGIRFENRATISAATNCNGSETYIKKKVKAQLAKFYTDYPWLSVEITSFKGQNGYSDKEDPKKFIYPYKIEMTVYLKRIITKEGKDFTEYTIYKYDAEYEYATKPKKKCDFYILPSSGIKLVTKEEFEVKKPI